MNLIEKDTQLALKLIANSFYGKFPPIKLPPPPSFTTTYKVIRPLLSKICGMCLKYLGKNMTKTQFLPCNHHFCRSCDSEIDFTDDDLKCPYVYCNRKVTDHIVHM